MVIIVNKTFFFNLQNVLEFQSFPKTPLISPASDDSVFKIFTQLKHFERSYSINLSNFCQKLGNFMIR